MKKLLFIVMVAMMTTRAQARIWRVNNNAGVSADFSSLATAVSNAAVLSGDTIHVEPSATTYAFPTLNKVLVIIGNGYLLSGAGGNTGLQENSNVSSVGGFTFNSSSAGSKIIGITVTSGTDFLTSNITFEKCRFVPSNIVSSISSGTVSNIAFRKCLFANGLSFNIGGSTTLNNGTFENCIITGNSPIIQIAAGTNFVIRNNVFSSATNASLQNAYVANNLFLTASNCVFTSCNVKNNIFTNNQTGVVSGPLSVNGNNLVNQPLASIIVNSGSDDGKFQLAVGSPAIGGGVDISGTKPDCGAFGGTDPYKLSGIPNIPTIYSLTVPASIPVGTSTMNVTLSTRNNN